MSLLETELAVLCELRDFGAMTEVDLDYAVPGAPDLLPGLCARGYVDVRAVAERRTEWQLTDGGLDVVDGDGCMDGMGQLIGTANAHTQSQRVPAASRTAGPTAPMGSDIGPSWWRASGRPVAEVVFLLTRQGHSTDDTAVIATMPRPAPAVVRSTLLRLIEDGILTGEPVRPVEGAPALRVVDVGVTSKGAALLRGTHPPEGPAGPATCRGEATGGIAR